jgi:hypothetical protein
VTIHALTEGLPKEERLDGRRYPRIKNESEHGYLLLAVPVTRTLEGRFYEYDCSAQSQRRHDGHDACQAHLPVRIQGRMTRLSEPTKYGMLS